MHNRLKAFGAEPAPGSPAQLGDFLVRETERWGKLLREADIRPPQ